MPAAIAVPVPPGVLVAPVPHPELTPDVMLLLLRPGTRSGRSVPGEVPVAFRERLAERNGLNGYPDTMDKIPLVHQPLRTFSRNPFDDVNIGKW